MPNCHTPPPFFHTRSGSIGARAGAGTLLFFPDVLQRAREFQIGWDVPLENGAVTFFAAGSVLGCIRRHVGAIWAPQQAIHLLRASLWARSDAR